MNVGLSADINDASAKSRLMHINDLVKSRQNLFMSNSMRIVTLIKTSVIQTGEQLIFEFHLLYCYAWKCLQEL